MLDESLLLLQETRATWNVQFELGADHRLDEATAVPRRPVAPRPVVLTQLRHVGGQAIEIQLGCWPQVLWKANFAKSSHRVSPTNASSKNAMRSCCF